MKSRTDSDTSLFISMRSFSSGDTSSPTGASGSSTSKLDSCSGSGRILSARHNFRNLGMIFLGHPFPLRYLESRPSSNNVYAATCLAKKPAFLIALESASPLLRSKLFAVRGCPVISNALRSSSLMNMMWHTLANHPSANVGYPPRKGYPAREIVPYLEPTRKTKFYRQTWETKSTGRCAALTRAVRFPWHMMPAFAGQGVHSGD